MNFLTRFLNNLNTHTIGGVGLGTALVGVGALALQHPIDSAIQAHVSNPGTAAVLSAVLNSYVQQYAAPVISIGAALAYAGRPGNVPPGPVQTQDAHVGVGPQVAQ